MNKYCRICWNTSHWREPTGEAATLEATGAYVADNGFGHEEWLFNFSWLQPGPQGTSGRFKYGFLQPIGKFRKTYEGKSFDVFLYTVTPDGERVAVGIISNLYVPQDDELKAAFGYMRKQGWLEEMKSNLAGIGASAKGLMGTPPDVINVRFRQTDVEFFEPRFALPKDNVVSRIHRYHPLNWEDGTPSAGKKSLLRRPGKEGVRRSEADRIRAAVESTVYSPSHVRLQNALFDHLCDRYGRKAVRYEQGYIDLQLHHGGTPILFEIKIAPTAKSCIRQAIGQLLEYDLYPDKQRSSQLIVVGDGAANPEDEAYLLHLKKKFRLPISYRQWIWDRSSLDREF